ncbi:hypothetical protein OF381_00060 [Mannheimia haemolytica]
MKRAFILLPIIFSSNAFADEMLFSCLTEKNNIISLINKGDMVEYQVASDKTDKITFSFETPLENMNYTSSVEDGVVKHLHQVSNNGYRYDLLSVEANSRKIYLGVEARDPNGKLVSKNACKEFLELLEKAESKKGNTNSAKKTNITPNATYGAGTYKVGVDIPAGEYKVYATSRDGTGTVFVSKTSNYRDISNMVHHEIFNNHTYVTVSEGQYLRVSFGKFELVK